MGEIIAITHTQYAIPTFGQESKYLVVIVDISLTPPSGQWSQTRHYELLGTDKNSRPNYEVSFL